MKMHPEMFLLVANSASDTDVPFFCCDVIGLL